MEKMIIIAAITGGAAGTPSMSPYLPITPKQIIDEAIACAEAGANIVHFHVINPKTGQQIGDIELYKEISSAVKKRSNVVLKPSTGGGDMEARCETVRVLKPEMVAIVPGSQNIVLAPMAEEVKEWKFDWEKPYLEDTWGLGNVQQNSFEELLGVAAICAESETNAGFEICDLSQINNVAYLISRGALKTPIYMDFSMGTLGKAPASIDNLAFYVRTAKELIGDIRFTTCCHGSYTMTLQAASMEMGGDVRVGLQDSLHRGNGQVAKSNAELVEDAVQIARILGREIATPDEVRKMLKLKGIDKVNF